MSVTYPTEYLPATREILDTLVDEIALLGGTVPDVADDGQLLFARALLATDTEVRPGDTISAGIAVRATASAIVVHPYTFRQVCSNGAIAAHALQSRSLERILSTEVFLPIYDTAMTLSEFRDAVRACATPEAFETATSEMRSTSEVKADFVLQLLFGLARLPQHMVAHVLPQIYQRFDADSDRSAFGLLNAVTSVARDAHDAETRWSLEELGGTMSARLQWHSWTAPTASAAGMSRRTAECDLYARCVEGSPTGTHIAVDSFSSAFVVS